MPERSASGRVTAELESELARLDREQLMRLCAHLIRTYVIEPGRSGVPRANAAAERGTNEATPASPQETTARPPQQATAPAPAETPPPRARQSRTATTEPETPAPSPDGRFNKLEMD